MLAIRSLFAAGEYQQVRDGKTLVWNGMPTPGDTATWSGDHDKDNYATGFGDLTWYDASGKEQALLYGNMIRGKFEGPVNMHTNGRTMHAYYANGGRVTGWSRGRAPSNMPAPAEGVAEKRKAEADGAKQEIAKAAEPESTPPQSRERAARGPDTYHKETAEKPAIVAEKKNEPMPIPTPPTLHETAPADSAQHSITEAQPSTPDRASAESPPAAKGTRADVSVNALAGPPTSLRAGAIPESSPEKQEPPPTPKPEGPLTESEVISLVETDARNNGAPIDQYEQPKVDHSAVRGKWTLFYARKPEANAQLPAAFTATVEDKTHKVKVEIRR